jgi:hypothetical protein
VFVIVNEKVVHVIVEVGRKMVHFITEVRLIRRGGTEFIKFG